MTMLKSLTLAIALAFVALAAAPSSALAVAEINVAPGKIKKANESWKRIEHLDPEQLS